MVDNPGQKKRPHQVARRVLFTGIEASTRGANCMQRQTDGDWMAGVVNRNIRAVIERQKAEQKRIPFEIRLADGITRFTGSMSFVYIHLVLFGVWIACNLPGTPLPKFDPSFVVLAMVASVEAIFLSTFVLISQNRMAAQAARRADLDLQVSLLAEHEVTQLITMVKAIAQRLELEVANDPELPELERDVAPEQVLDVIEKQERDSARD
jgi:uncharacterized membrane protein